MVSILKIEVGIMWYLPTVRYMEAAYQVCLFNNERLLLYPPLNVGISLSVRLSFRLSTFFVSATPP